MSKRVALYIRVSTEEQARQGLSLDAQEQDLRNFAERKGYSVVGLYVDDGASARKSPFKRKAFKRLLIDVEQGLVDRILFIKLDRWFRSVRDYYKAQDILDSHSVDWETTQEQYNTTTTNGRLMLNVKLSVAQNESDMTSDRIKFVFEQKRARHEVVTGSFPTGYKIENKHLVPDDKTAQYIIKTFDTFNRTHNLSETLKYLRSVGYYHNYASLRYLLRNETYIGKNGTDLEFCKPIISQEVFYGVQDVLNKRKVVKATPSKLIYLFSGLIRCAVCGNKFTANYSYKNAKKEKRKRYRCQTAHTRKVCTNTRNIKEEVIEQALLQRFDSLYRNRKAVVHESVQQQVVDTEKVKHQLQRLKELFINDLITLEEYKKDAEQYNKLLSIRPITMYTVYDKKLEDGIRPLYDTLSEKQRQGFWRQIIDYIVVDEQQNIEVFFK